MTNAANTRELLDELSELIVQPEIPGSQGNSVRIMSLYKSKGLTAKVVIIAGCVAGILPSIHFDLPLAEQERQRQEHRRLFYVGITRSTDTLVISSATSILPTLPKPGLPSFADRAVVQSFRRANSLENSDQMLPQRSGANSGDSNYTFETETETMKANTA